MKTGDILQIIECAIIFTLIILCINYCGRCKEESEQAQVVHDTTIITKIDTLIYEKPIFKKQYIHDTLLLVKTDTLYDTIAIPKVTNIYEDSTYYAEVSGGYFASLDKIRVYPTNQYIQSTQTKHVKEKPILSIVGGVGVGWNGESVKPYIGVTVGVPIFNVYKSRP